MRPLKPHIIKVVRFFYFNSTTTARFSVSHFFTDSEGLPFAHENIGAASFITPSRIEKPKQA